MTNKDIRIGILSIIRKSPIGLSIHEVAKNKKFTRAPKRAVLEVLNKLISEKAIELKKGKYCIAKEKGEEATILRVRETFGIGVLSKTNEEIFIRGSFLKGALPNEKVEVLKVFSMNFDDSYEVTEITQRIKNYEFVGNILENEGIICIKADKLLQFCITVAKDTTVPYKIGDKVLAKIIRRGNRHSDIVVDIINNYGHSENSAVCARAVLDSNGITEDFLLEVDDQAKRLNHRGIKNKDLFNRTDLRGQNIFTIDSADSMDLDDAVSLEVIGDDYLLGVHIADVSHYVKENTELDIEALNRGTSIYYANKVVPMLPKALSNGICSLNPLEDRLAFSVFLTLDKMGKLIDFEFKKTIINSRVKGVYNEINTIINDTATDEIKDKYKGQIELIHLMDNLADILIKNKSMRGAPDIEKAESKYIIDDNGVCVDVVPRTRGKSECIIEEFMLTANEAAAKAARLYELPFIYRIHEPVSPAKAEELADALKILGMDARPLEKKITALTLSNILRENKKAENNIAINNIVLRSMSKARYSENPVGHFGLALEDYAHFTSPIRRYPDLMIHRILTEYISDKDSQFVKKMFKNKVEGIAKQNSDAEVLAVTIERGCEDCYKAEYMKNFIGNEFDAVIISIKNYGFYIALDNTVEGLVHTETLPSGEYELMNAFMLKDMLSGKEYKVGDKIKVICTKAEISAGKIGFALVTA